MTKLSNIALIAAFLLCTVRPAMAIPIVFPNRALFEAAVSGLTVEGWDAFAAGTVFPNGTTNGGITYNSSAGNAVVTSSFLTSSAPNGLGVLPQQFFLGGDSMTFGFGVPLDAFAIDINTFDLGDGAYTATTNTGEVVASFFDPFPGFGTGQFIGFSTSLPFTSVTIAGAGLPYTLDTLQLSPVPEPASMLLVVAVLAGFGVRRYRLDRRV